MNPEANELTVFLVWHAHLGADDHDEVKLLGVFSTEELALQSVKTASALPGFRDSLEGFEVAEYEMDSVQWSGGFVVMDGMDVPAWFANGGD